MKRFEHILLASDLSELAHNTGREAVELAEAFRAKLSLVHVIEAVPSYVAGYYPSGNLEAELIAQAKEELQNLGNELKIPTEDLHIKIDSPKLGILKVAKDLKADLIIVGSHGHHGLGRLLGSTAAAIVHGAECDVLVVKPDNK